MNRQNIPASSTLLTVARTASQMGHYVEAREILLRAMSLCERSSGKESLGYARCTEELAAVCMDLEDWERADLYLRQSLKSLRAILPAGDTRLAIVLRLLAESCRHCGEHAEAKRLELEASTVVKKRLESAIKHRRHKC